MTDGTRHWNISIEKTVGQESPWKIFSQKSSFNIGCVDDEELSEATDTTFAQNTQFNILIPVSIGKTIDLFHLSRDSLR